MDVHFVGAYGTSHDGTFCALRGSSTSKKGSLLYGNAMIVMKEWSSPGIYINIHEKTVKIDPKSLDPNTEVMRF